MAADILVIDDEADIRELVSGILEDEGHQVRTARGSWMQVLLVIDVYSRELLDLRAHDGWDVDAAWTTRAFNEILVRTARKPAIVVCGRS